MKKILTFLGHCFILTLILMQAVPQPAHAYLDPGMGSSIIQIIIAALATGSYLVKVFWRQISGFFGKIFGGKKSGKKSDKKSDDEKN